MRKNLILIVVILFIHPVYAQRSLIPQQIVGETDNALNRIFYAAEKKDSSAVNEIITELDKLIQPYIIEYPEFTGVMQLHLAFYATSIPERNQWTNKAIHLLKKADSSLATTFSGNFLWLIKSYSWEKRMDEWKRVDTVYRQSVNKGKDPRQFAYAILNQANFSLSQKEYAFVSNLAQYELTYLESFNTKTTYQKINKIFAGWLELSQKFEQWKKLSYSKQTGNKYYMNEGQVVPDFLQDKNEDSLLVSFDYNHAFKKLVDETDALQKEFITSNHRSDANFDEGKRNNYFFLFSTILFGYYEWALLSQNESKPLLPLKLFLWQDVKDEMDDSKKHQKHPLIHISTIVNAYNSLSVLYNAMGNAELASDVLNEGLGQIVNHPVLTQDEKLRAVEFYPQFVAAYRSEGNFEKANDGNKKWLSLVNKPDTLITKENVADLERYYNPKIEEVFTLMAMEKFEEGKQKTIRIIDSIAALVVEDESIIYETKTWVKLQYLTSVISAQNGKWNSQLIKEMISDLMQGRSNMNILYPAHLLMLKAEWITHKKVNEEYLGNLLRYTEKQLFTNFTMLNAQERMQYFSMRLQEFFDVYHELLFTSALDQLPDLKQQVLDQSLFLKNSLSDGNLIPDEVFASYAKRDPSYIKKLRALRQSVILTNDKRKLYNRNSDAQILNDQFQQLWLDALNNTGSGNAAKISQQKLIDSKLPSDAVYIETVRYKKWLSDSSITYGAFVFEKNKPVQIISICSEDTLSKILNNPAASPQTAAVANNISRGIELLGKKDSDKKNYKPGDKDLLAELLLTPLQSYLSKKEWILANDGLLNRISFSALLYKNKYLTESIKLRHLSSAAQLGNESKKITGKKILLAGDIHYGNFSSTVNNSYFKPSIQWNYLPGTKTETLNLQKIMQQEGYETHFLSGTKFQDSLYNELGNYNIIHLATHGFYYKAGEAGNYFNKKFSAKAIEKEPLFRCGLAVSNANNPGMDEDEKTPGYILGYELANTDLRNCFLVTLSACETGLGDLRNNMGVDGLSRALKIGGAKNLLISLWKVPDEPTAAFMQHFYTALFRSGNPAEALRYTQLKMCRQYKAIDWAAFVLVE